jgi:hypothetical protein
VCRRKGDEAAEGRLETGSGMVETSRHGVAATKQQGKVVRPSRLVASVGYLLEG